MEVFIAYSESGAPVGISPSVEQTQSEITRIEKEYKFTNPKLIGRTYTITKVRLVPDKLNEYNIIRTIPIQSFEPIKFSTNGN